MPPPGRYSQRHRVHQRSVQSKSSACGRGRSGRVTGGGRSGCRSAGGCGSYEDGARSVNSGGEACAGLGRAPGARAMSASAGSGSSGELVVRLGAVSLRRRLPDVGALRAESIQRLPVDPTLQALAVTMCARSPAHSSTRTSRRPTMMPAMVFESGASVTWRRPSEDQCVGSHGAPNMSTASRAALFATWYEAAPPRMTAAPPAHVRGRCRCVEPVNQDGPDDRSSDIAEEQQAECDQPVAALAVARLAHGPTVAPAKPRHHGYLEHVRTSRSLPEDRQRKVTSHGATTGRVDSDHGAIRRRSGRSPVRG